MGGIECHRHDGVPNGEELETPVQAEPAATATSVKSEFERSVHPEFCGVKYDELHSTTVKHITQVTQQWPGKKQTHEVNVASFLAPKPPTASRRVACERQYTSKKPGKSHSTGFAREN